MSSSKQVKEEKAVMVLAEMIRQGARPASPVSQRDIKHAYDDRQDHDIGEDYLSKVTDWLASQRYIEKQWAAGDDVDRRERECWVTEDGINYAATSLPEIVDTHGDQYNFGFEGVDPDV